MAREYASFDIRLRGSGPRYAVIAQSALAGEANGTFIWPLDGSRYQELAARLQQPDAGEDATIELGTLLFQSLFQGPMKELYARTLQARGRDQGLRLSFDVDRSQANIADLPWEFLYDPEQGPLAGLGISVVRYLPQPWAQPPLALQLPLRMLVTAAMPAQAPEVARELAEVRAGLARLADAGLVAIQVEEQLTRSILQRRLREGFPIWHFIGQSGQDREDGPGRLLLEDSAGASETISAAELNILLNRSGLRLVVLDACNSAQPFRGIATTLVRVQLPAAIAMRFTAPEAATRPFVEEFYRALATGYPLDASVTAGRKAILGAIGLNTPDWGSPVVYTRSADGILFERPTASSVPDQSSGTGINVSSRIREGTAADHRENVQLELTERHKRYLRVLEVQAASFGLKVDPAIVEKIEDLRAEIARLEAELAKSPADRPTTLSVEEETAESFPRPAPPAPSPQAPLAEPPAQPPSPQPPASLQQRRFEAAMPRSAQVGRTTEIRTMIALPPSEGLRRFLPSVTEAGDVIARDDVTGREVLVEFGDAAWATLYLEVRAPGFDVEEPLKPLRVPRSSDSGVATFVITPRQAGRDSRVVVNLFEDAARQRQLDSLTLMVDIKRPSLGMFFEEVWQIVTSSVSGAGPARQGLVAATATQQVVYVNVRNETVIHGDQYNLTGTFQGSNINIKSNLTNASQSIGALAQASQTDKDELQRLLGQLNGVLQQAPAEHAAAAEAVAALARRLLDSASATPRNPATVQLASDGLRAAADQVAAALPAAGPIVAAMIAHVGRLAP
jgi:hypothetical protein